MSGTHFSGPVTVWGRDVAGSTQGANPKAGPSLFYEGTGLFDPRTPYQPGLTGYGRIAGYHNSGLSMLLDSVPAALGTTTIAAAQTVTALTAMTLVSTAAYGIQPKMQLVPFGSQRSTANQVSTLIGLDVGFGSVTITAAAKACSSLLTFDGYGTGRLWVGQPIWIGGAGASGAPLFTTVATITSATAFTVADAASTSVTAKPIGTADDNLVTPDMFQRVGVDRMFDPFQATARAVNIATANGAADQNITVAGYDIYGQPMTEVIAAVHNTTVAGKKAFKYIASVTPTSTDATASAYSVGTTDVFGFAMRVDRFEHARIYQAGALITANTGWLTADSTSPATTTTGDVRGTYSLQTASNGSAVATGRRTVFGVHLTPNQLRLATPDDYSSLFGITQV